MRANEEASWKIPHRDQNHVSGWYKIWIYLAKTPKHSSFIGICRVSRPIRRDKICDSGLYAALRMAQEKQRMGIAISTTCGFCRKTTTNSMKHFSHCEKCDTYYHEECWNYIGACSRYGCENIPSKIQKTKNYSILPTLSEFVRFCLYFTGYGMVAQTNHPDISLLGFALMMGVALHQEISKRDLLFSVSKISMVPQDNNH